MQLNITTDYAVRTMVYLADKNQIVNSEEISSNLGIPKNYVYKVISKLKKAGMVKTKAGVKNGGVYITKSPEEISLLDIVAVMEKTAKINRCLEEDGYCSRCATDSCPVHKFFCDFQSEIEERLKGMTIADLIKG